MRWRISCLALVGLSRGVAHGFSVHDDLFAFPQYEVIFSDRYVSQEEALAKLTPRSHASLDPNTIGHHEHAQSSEGESKISELRSVKDPLVEDNASTDGDLQTYERLLLKNRTYLCSIPQARPLRNETEEKVSPEEEEKELLRATDRGWELLEGMKGNCIYYQSGWWSYSLCYQTEIKQFHPQAPPKGAQAMYPPVEDPRVPSFRLGEFPEAQKKRKEVDGGHSGEGLPPSKRNSKPDSKENAALAIRKKGDTRYLVQKLSGGSTCDLTGRPRKVEVQFHCHPQSADRIGWIKEIATCTYLMVVYTPRLCNDVAFLPPKEHKAAPIVCSEVMSEEQIAAWHARQASRTEDLLLGGGALKDLSEAAAPIRPVVGGIEVGGMKMVGDSGKLISPPQLVEQVQTPGLVIAQWDPNRHDGVIEMLRDEKLRELGLDPDVVEETREELHLGAEGRPWKLEVVDLGDGVHELVGVVESFDNEDDHIDLGRAESEHTQEEQEQEKQDQEPHDEERSENAADGRSRHGRKGERAQKGSQERFKDEL